MNILKKICNYLHLWGNTGGPCAAGGAGGCAAPWLIALRTRKLKTIF